jgi:hypothetical protein
LSNIDIEIKIQTIERPMEIPPLPYTDPIPQPSKNEVYCLIVDWMMLNVQYKTRQKLSILKQRIRKGYQSPKTLSMELFEINLFPFSYKDYVSMYLALKEGL